MAHLESDKVSYWVACKNPDCWTGPVRESEYLACRSWNEAMVRPERKEANVPIE